MVINWINNFSFIIWFRISTNLRFMKRKYIRKQKVDLMSSHRVKVIDHKGRFLLCECQNCKERILAVDQIEAKGIYSRMECVVGGGE